MLVPKLDTKRSHELFRQGVLTEAVITPEEQDSDNLIIMVTAQDGEQKPVTRARTVHRKIYKSVISALRDCRNIGFKEIKVILN